MTFWLIAIVVMLGLLIWQVAADTRLGRQLLTRASDLNLERQDQIIRRLEVIEMQLVDMPKLPPLER